MQLSASAYSIDAAPAAPYGAPTGKSGDKSPPATAFGSLLRAETKALATSTSSSGAGTKSNSSQSGASPTDSLPTTDTDVGSRGDRAMELPGADGGQATSVAAWLVANGFLLVPAPVNDVPPTPSLLPGDVATGTLSGDESSPSTAGVPTPPMADGTVAGPGNDLASTVPTAPREAKAGLTPSAPRNPSLVANPAVTNPASDAAATGVPSLPTNAAPNAGLTAPAQAVAGAGEKSPVSVSDAGEGAAATDAASVEVAAFGQTSVRPGAAARASASADQGRTQAILTQSTGTEKFAADLGREMEPVRGLEKRGQIKSLIDGSDDVADAYAPIGINTAKAEATMPALATSTPSPSAATEPVSLSASPLSFDAMVKGDASTAEQVSGARRAVESAVAMTEHFSSVDRSSVNLQFKVSGVDLAVRVEMRADGVHTTFRTDSPELRAALAHEWQSVTAQTPERQVRLADPVFASNSSGTSLQSDAGSAQQRDPGARNTPAFSELSGAIRSAANRPVVVAPSSPVITAPVAPMAGRLHTFA